MRSGSWIRAVAVAVTLAMQSMTAGTALAQAEVPAIAEAPVVAEARAFMASYARDLIAGDRAAIAARYDRRGARLLGRGETLLLTHAGIVALYAGREWQPPAAFEWRDLGFEPIGPDAVAITGQFAWTERAGGRPLFYSYSAVLIRQDGVLRIRIEHEDPAPEARSAN